ncbi:hypothetical protein [Corynebacterium sp. p3-SID1194]|uniref:hypothetical protein n=1 Tax=Corynebacterium sp. p3-SID1194 TaxID=2916105 RepID=UPI0021A58267|nr:hypothetical protein [Corynebacterium sp. p3-SID1194]MCT1449110.1 hypothetical protein [Corynebacterium sp. p3-SID1194]
MKIRKSILAAATAATVSVSGVVAAPAFAADEPAKDENVTTEDNNKNESEGKDGESEGKKDEDKKDEDKSFGAKLKANSSDDNGDWDPKAITAWISVFTAVLGLVGSVVTFAQKNFKLPF